MTTADQQEPLPPRRRRSDARRGRPAPPSHGREHPASTTEALANIIVDVLTVPTGLRVSAVTVMVLAVAAVASWMLPGSQWSFGPIIGVASWVLAFGWPMLTGVRMRTVTQIVIGLAGLVIPLSVAAHQDLQVAADGLGLALVVVVLVSILTAPAPRPHDINPGPNGGEGSADDQPLDRTWASTSMTSSVASAVTALLIVVGGSAWVALDSLVQWSVTVPIACFVVVVVVWGDQLGTTFRAQSISAVISAVLGGVVAALVAWRVGSAAALLPVVLPGVAASAGELTAILLLGILAGIAVALAVIVIDGLLGDHSIRRPPLGAMARGAAKFLVAAIPVYAMIRIGGV